MQGIWHKAYSDIKEFISEHPVIKMEANRTDIPESVRPEFYRLFDRSREAFIEYYMHNLLEDAKSLSQQYLRLEQELTNCLGLDRIQLSDDSHRFLHNPIIQLIRVLNDPLFALLKGKLDSESFNNVSMLNIRNCFAMLYQTGYEKWVTLSLLKMAQADEIMQTEVEEIPMSDVVATGGRPYRTVPQPKIASCLLCKYPPDVCFVVPDWIAHSRKTNSYISGRSEISSAHAIASNANENREWQLLPDNIGFKPGLTVIYLDDNAENISLVAYKNYICRPDLLLECRAQENWLEKQGLGDIKLHHDTLKPKLGTYIISRQTLPELAINDMGGGIKAISVGFDESRLEPIIQNIHASYKN